MGLENEAVDLTLEMTSHYMQCAKTLIYDFCTTYNIWNGDEAKYFEDCVESEEVVAEFTTWEFVEKKSDNLWSGTVEPTSVTACHPLPLVGTARSAAAQSKYVSYAYDRIRSYMKSEYETTGSVLPTVSVPAMLHSLF